MSWFMTTDTAEFLNVAGEFLRAEAARNSVMLTVTADLEAAGPGAGDSGMLFGWQRPEAGPLTAAFMHTPGYPVMLSGMSETAAAALARDFASAGHQVPGVNAAQQAADAFTVAWRELTGDPVTVYRRMRLFRLARLVPPGPAPGGSARAAAGAGPPGGAPGRPPGPTGTCSANGSGPSPARSATSPRTITVPT